MNATRMFATGVAAICLSLATAGAAIADAGASQGKGLECFGPPGQSIVKFDQNVLKGTPAWFPPGQAISFCAQSTHGGF